MQIIKPPTLKPGDTIGIIAPSDLLPETNFTKSLAIVESWGLKVKIGKYVKEKFLDYMAGTIEQRQEDLRSMIYDPEVKAIWSIRGGYCCMDVLPVFDEKTAKYLRKNPIWFIGFSDICTLLNVMTSLGVASIHGPTFWQFFYWDQKSQDWLRRLLFGEIKDQEVVPLSLTPLVLGDVSGRLLVSDVDILIRLLGTKFDPIKNCDDDIILCLEETSNWTEDVIRSLDQILNHTDVFKIKGIILGRFVGLHSNDYPKWAASKTIYEHLTDRVRLFHQVPVYKTWDFGHSQYDATPDWKIKLLKLAKKPETFTTLLNGYSAEIKKDILYVRI